MPGASLVSKLPPGHRCHKRCCDTLVHAIRVRVVGWRQAKARATKRRALGRQTAGVTDVTVLADDSHCGHITRVVEAVVTMGYLL